MGNPFLPASEATAAKKRCPARCRGLRSLALGLLMAIFLGVVARPSWSADSVVVGGDFNYPPYEFIDADGQPAGYNVDLTRAVAEAMGIAVEIHLAPWRETRTALSAGTIDAVQGMFFSPERDLAVDFSTPHTVVHHAVFLRRGERRVTSLDDLRGKRIVVMAGDIMHDYVVERKLSPTLALAPTQADALRQLAAGKHDFALVARLPGLYWVRSLKLNNLVAAGLDILPSRYCFAVRQGNAALLARFNEGLAVVKNSGRYREITDRWFGVLDPPGIDTRRLVRYAIMGLVPVVVILLGFVFWNRSLRARVADRTRALSSEMDRRLQATAELEQSYGELEKIFDGLDALVYIADMESHEILFMNAHGQKEFGDFTGRKCWQVLQQRNGGPCPFCTNDKLLHPDGTAAGVYRWEFQNTRNHRWYDVRDRAIRWADRRMVRLEIAFDITDRKRLEEALRSSLTLNQKLGGAAEEKVIAFGLEEGCRITDSAIGYFHQVNEDQKTIRLMAWSAATLKRCRVGEKQTHYPIDQAGVWVDCIREKRPVIHNDYAALAQRQGLPDGHVPVVRDMAVPVFEGQKIVAVMGVGNKKGDYTEGDVDRLSLVAETLWRLLRSRQYETALRRAHDELESRVAQRTSELSQANARLRVEIQERKQARAEAQRAHQLASLGEMAAGVAHEINNPINGVINYAQILVDEAERESVQVDLGQRILSEGERIASIVRNLLAFAREQREEKSPEDLSTIVSHSLMLMGSQLHRDGVAVHVAVPDDLPQVMVNAQQIQQVLMNLLANARHALRDDECCVGEEKRIDIRCRRLEKGGIAMVRTEVVDNGCGIVEAIQDRIFDPFFSTKPADCGSGLGLSISHGLVKDHGGDIRIESVPGKFTRVRVDLPAVVF